MYFIAIYPPNNADAAFLKMKRDLFYNKSILSAWALRPMVPLAFLSGLPDKPKPADLPAVPAAGLKFDSVERLDDQLFLQSEDCVKICKDILKMPCIRGLQPVTCPAAGGFPAGSGLHLMDCREDGSPELENLIRRNIAELDESVKNWKTCSLCLYEVEFMNEIWWKGISLQQFWEVRLHRGR